MNLLILLVGALAASTVFAQPNSFVLDTSKPFVYLKFDHVGSRKPAREGEAKRGMWLRLVNNCRLPISVLTFDLGTGDPGTGLNYTVLPAGGMRSVRVAQSGRTTEVPRGYSSDTGSPAKIEPGNDLLFSIPSDHITEDWHIQLNFEFDLPEPKEGVHPYGVAAFYWESVPEKDRTALGKADQPDLPRKKPD